MYRGHVANYYYELRLILLLWSILLTLFANIITCEPIYSTEDMLTPQPHIIPGGACSGIVVEVIISPQFDEDSHDRLILYWEATTVLPGDKVALYDHDPSLRPGEPLYSVIVENKTGWITTDISETRNSTLPFTFFKTCLGYWAAYVRHDSGTIAAYSCLSTEPRWMEDSWKHISRLSLANMFLPGTHNSAAYKEGFYNDNLVFRYTFNQEISVLNQLLWGARVLDLRIGYYHNTDELWWCNHDFVRLSPLKHVLNGIKTFINNTNELVILDVHNFPVGFSKNSNKMHVALLSFFEEELQGYLAPVSLEWDVKLTDLKQSGKQVILAYNSYEVKSPYKWPPIQQKWANVQRLSELALYFQEIFNGQQSAPWAAMVQLTPKPFDVLLNRLGGLRNMANTVNPTVTLWFNGRWGRLCHVVHCDYIRGTGIVNAAIRWNLKRAGHRGCRSLHHNLTIAK